MAFQIKNFVSIVASMMNHAKATQNKVTDYNIGSVFRTMIEAPAIEIDELYQQMFIGLKEAIPVATYNSFQFAKLESIPTSGNIQVNITANPADVTVVANTVFSFDGAATKYVSQNDTTITAGNTTASVRVVASTPGVIGNIPAAKSFTATPAPSGFVNATNAVAFSNGTDEETDDQRLQRFKDFVATLPRGTVASLKYGARQTKLYDANGIQTEGVASAEVVEPYLTDNTQPVGLIDVYIHNGIGSTSGALVTECSKIIYGYTDVNGNPIPGWKAAGTVVNVFAATEVALPVTGTITVADGYDHPTLAAAANGVVAAYITALPIGGTFIRAEAVFLVMSIPGITNFVPTAPATTEVTSTSSQKLMPGTMAIT